MIIDRFNNEFKFLSNFAASTFFYDGKKFPTVEHAYQSLKSSDPIEQEEIRNAISPSQAKKLGKSVKQRDNWDNEKNQIMFDLLRLKFENPFLRHKLKETKQAILIEGNVWHDNHWGDCKCDKCHDIIGQNFLGKLLMSVRDEIIKEDASEGVL